jgi:hypothetical protein
MRTTLRRPAIAVALALALSGCADAVSPSGGAADARVAPPADGAPLPPLDARVRPDAGRGGGFMDACQDNLDCASGWCVQFGDLDVCTVTCLDQGCPAGWGCRAVQNTGADVVSICVPPRPADRLCHGCAGDADCPGGRCYRLGDRSVCGLDCRNDQGCPPDYECREVSSARECVPRSLTCACDDCDAGPPDAAPADAHVADARPADAHVADARPVPDAHVVDAAVPDAAMPDAHIVDARPAPDARAVDAAPPIPDARIVDARLPDAAMPDAAIPDAAIPDAMPVPDAAPPVPDAMLVPDAAPKLPYGSVCDRASDCQSDLCVGDPVQGRGRCTLQCVHAADCPGIDACLPAGGGVNVCFRNETGSPCLGPAGCVEGICLTPPDPVPWVTVQPICVSRCEDGRHCPAGYRCDVVQTNQGPTRACTPDVAPINTCPDGFIEECVGTCAVPRGRNELDVTLCLNEGGAGYCSCTCVSAADCPAGFACSRVGLSEDPTRPGVCLAMSGYRCPIQGARGAPDQCLSLTCVTPDEGADASYCSAPCTHDVDCPADYTCSFVAGEGACVPAAP